MTNYKQYLLEKYETIIRKAVVKPRVTMGVLINNVFKEYNDTEKTKSEIRDAILVMTGEGSLTVEAISQKRLEVSLSSKVL